MARSNEFAAVVRLRSTVPSAATTNLSVDMPAGAYRIQVNVNSNVTGTTTTVALSPFVDEAKSQVGGPFYTAPSSAVAIESPMTIAAGASGKSARVVAASGSTAINQQDPVVMIANGLQVQITKGGAVTAELFELELLVCPVERKVAPVVTVS